MITIIVSSYKPDLFKQFKKNVEETVGVKHEIIKIDNNKIMGLCEAYNRGTRKANYEYICFSHEDIIFNTKNWGVKLINVLEGDKKIGIVGIAGSSYKTWIPSGWSFDQDSFVLKRNYIQINNNKHFHVYNNPNKEELSEVASIDGCWFGTRRSLITKYPFDEQLFKDYHCYDIDLCLNIGENYKIVVTYDILLTHLSLGGFDKKWLEETFKLHKKWKNLPRATEDISQKERFYQELFALRDLIKRFKIYNNPKFLYSIFLSRKLFKTLGFVNWLKFHFAFIKLIAKQKK